MQNFAEEHFNNYFFF